MAEPSGFDVQRAPLIHRRGGAAAILWMSVLAVVVGAAAIGRSPAPMTMPTAASAVVAAPATPSTIVRITPRTAVELAPQPSIAGGPYMVPWGWSREEGRKRAAELEQGPRADNLAGVVVAPLRNGRMLVR